ncbi:PKD domain-containing protein, partial [Flavobacteriaceae bacterium]|nr:PKD domain-containing protein [Flavobacteriaceae bacterium]
MKKYLLLSFMLLPFIGLSQDILISEGGTINTCSGTLLDSGGASGNYSSNENYSITICPDNPGQNIELDFTSFSTQLNADILTIYDGPDNTGTGTTYSGNATQSPGFITATNATGCITVEFFSNAAANTTGFAANISCYEPCQEIIGSIDSVSPEPNSEGQVTVCPGEEVTFTASGEFSNSSEGATFAWEFGDGTTAEGLSVSKVYDQSGIFSAGLVITDTNPLGCSSLQITQIVIVAPSIDFTGTEAGKTELCFGDSTTLFGVAESTQLEDCAPEIFEQTWLEDTQTTGQQASYESTISVECYADGLEFTDISQLIQICVVIEHSFIGDLDMLLTAPNGQSVYFAQYGDGNDPGTSLGIPDELDNGNPGTGFEYCFTPDATADISSTGGTTVPAGIYGASNGSSFTDLLGTSLNGDWTFTVIDSWAADDGTIFSWNLDFDPALSAPPSEIISQVWLDDPSIVSVEGNNIVVSPTGSGEICYTYVVQDDFGCEYSETICINVEEEIVTEQAINLFICDPLTTDLFFDFTENESLISSIATDPDNLIISFYESLEDAENESNPITEISNYLGFDDQIINVRIEYLESNCYETQSFTLNVTDPPVVNPVDKLFICDDETDDGFVDYDLNNFNSQLLGDQSENDYLVSYYLSYDDAYNGTNALEMPYEISNNSIFYPRIDVIGTTGCFNVGDSDILSFQVNPPDDSSFEMTPTCDGGTATITGFFGGTFVFNEAPTDGAVIDSSTGLITGGDYNTTYSVSYTTNGDCPTTTIVSVTSIIADDSSFEMTPTCDGGTATITGLAGGTFTFDTAPTDGAVIDSSTGLITGGDYDTTYSVSYTTNGDCPTTTIVSVTSIIADDSSFEMTPTCDGGTATITGLAGGTFTFDTAPTDGAIIDSSTGTVSQGGYGVDYFIIYTTNGDCPTSSIVNFSSAVLPVISNPTPFEVCDDNIADGFVEMDLSIKNSEITNGNSNYAVTYYLTSEDASTANSPLTLPYTNISNPQTIFIRVVDIIYGCFVTTSMDLIVQSAPAANTPPVLEYCDADADGFGVFTLNEVDSEITSGQTGLIVTYHETQADAENNVNAITGDYNNIVQYQQT